MLVYFQAVIAISSDWDLRMDLLAMIFVVLNACNNEWVG